MEIVHLTTRTMNCIGRLRLGLAGMAAAMAAATFPAMAQEQKPNSKTVDEEISAKVVDYLDRNDKQASDRVGFGLRKIGKTLIQKEEKQHGTVKIAYAGCRTSQRDRNRGYRIELRI